MKEIKNNSFVFYSTFLETVDTLREADPALAAELLAAIAEYGIYGEFSCSNPVINALMVGIKTAIDKAKDRYNTACENGSRGGRPARVDKNRVAELRAQGMTNKQIAELLNCSISSIEKINRNNRNNLNDNDNDNVNDNNNRKLRTGTGLDYSQREYTDSEIRSIIFDTLGEMEK